MCGLRTKIIFSLLLSVIVVSPLFSYDKKCYGYCGPSTYLIDDFSDGDNQNELEYYWYYYDDNFLTGKNDRPQSTYPGTPSVINISYTTQPRHAFGNANDTYIIKNYRFTVQDEYSNRFATMPFTFGSTWEATSFTAYPYVGIVTMLCQDGESISLEGLEYIRFKIRSHNSNLKVTFKIQTLDIEQDSSFAFYQTYVDVTDSWSEKQIRIDSLRQPDWAGINVRPFDITKCTKLVWEVSQNDNKNLESDILDIDDVYISDTWVGINKRSTFPNTPTNFHVSYSNGMVKVDLTGTDVSSGTINLVDIKGSVAKRVPVAASCRRSINISSAGTASGMYFVKYDAVDKNGRNIKLLLRLIIK